MVRCINDGSGKIQMRESKKFLLQISRGLGGAGARSEKMLYIYRLQSTSRVSFAGVHHQDVVLYLVFCSALYVASILPSSRGRGLYQ